MSAATDTTDAWYTRDGADSDVILSSRVRFARNLAGFVFPVSIKSDDAERVQSILFDSFNQLDQPEKWQLVRMSNVDTAGKRILSERGVLDAGTGSESWRGVIINGDGVLSATVNTDDHLRLSAFGAGLSLSSCAAVSSAVEAGLRERVQFSALPDFGYLTSNLSDLGTGMKASVLVCLPALCLNSLLDRVIREYLAQGFNVRGYYGAEAGNSLGCLYQISGGPACSGDVPSQIRKLEQAALKLAELERKSRKDLAASSPTTLENTVFRAIVTAKYARFITLGEAVDLLQRIKLGVGTGLVHGIVDRDLTALLYRVQTAHIGFVISGGSVIIEEDVKGEELRMDRLRAMVIQEVLKEADIRERR